MGGPTLTQLTRIWLLFPCIPLISPSLPHRLILVPTGLHIGITLEGPIGPAAMEVQEKTGDVRDCHKTSAGSP